MLQKSWTRARNEPQFLGHGDPKTLGYVIVMWRRHTLPSKHIVWAINGGDLCCACASGKKKNKEKETKTEKCNKSPCRWSCHVTKTNCGMCAEPCNFVTSAKFGLHWFGGFSSCSVQSLISSIGRGCDHYNFYWITLQSNMTNSLSVSAKCQNIWQYFFMHIDSC